MEAKRLEKRQGADYEVCGTSQGDIGGDLASQTGQPVWPWRITNSSALSLALPNVCFDSANFPKSRTSPPGPHLTDKHRLFL
jgi:hypothetical protein